MSKLNAQPQWVMKDLKKESSKAGPSSQGNRARKRSRSPISESEDDEEEVGERATSPRNVVSRSSSSERGGEVEEAAAGSKKADGEKSSTNTAKGSQEVEDREESIESGKVTPEEIMDNDLVEESVAGNTEVTESVTVTVTVTDQGIDSEWEGASSATDVNSNVKSKDAPATDSAGSKSGRQARGAKDDNALGTDLRKRLRTTKRLRTSIELEEMLEDEISDYECRGDDKEWSKERKKNTRSRWNRRRDTLPSPPPLHELPGNRELVAEFEAYAKDQYTNKQTAQTITTNLFRRPEGNSLLHYMARKHSDMDFRLDRLVAFSKFKGYLPPVGAKEWIYDALPGREDFDATMQ